MKIRTTISLPEELVHDIDRRMQDFKTRSDFIEMAVRAFIAQLIRDEQNARDLAIINQRADQLNREATDVLAYQVPL
jgi:metal-responsive CopG/Arc/MetJ family transcriptional regulator